ncbi:MAG: arginase family protein [Chloroflexia bacterium]|nr:arginase family protein [Chloroflexia bacterium]
MPRPLAIIGTPSSAGAYAPGQELAPAALRQAGLLTRLSDAGHAVVDHGDSPLFRWRPDRAHPYAQNAAAVRDAILATAARVQAAAAAGQLPLVLGGDCTVGIGSVSGMLAANPERLGLIYFDLHADLNTPDSVPDGALDWMGMAHLLDEPAALAELRQVGPRTPLLTPEQIVVVGHSHARSTPWEREVIARRNVRTVPVEDVAAAPEDAARAALARLPDIDRLLIHFDVDVIDFVDAPLSENTGRNEGLTLDQALRALRVFTAHPAFAALTVTELNPLHGEADGATLERFVAGLVEALR